MPAVVCPKCNSVAKPKPPDPSVGIPWWYFQCNVCEMLLVGESAESGEAARPDHDGTMTPWPPAPLSRSPS